MALLNFTSFTMKMGAADSSKTLIIIYQIIRRRYSRIFHHLVSNYRKKLISVFHCALLQSVTFISRLMHSIIQNVDVKIYVV